MKQKKGISLIVLVIVIIVMLIISGAVIVSLTNANIIDMGENAVQKHNIESIEEAINLAYQDLMATNLGKVHGFQLAERLENLSKTYTEIQNITSGNGKVYYTLSLTGKEYQISTTTGEILEYVDEYAKVVGYTSDWVRSGTTITNYIGDNLKDITVPNVLKDENGNEVKITKISLKGIDFQGTLTISDGLIIPVGGLTDCVNIEELIIGNDVSLVTFIREKGPFSGCTNLRKVTMGRNIKFTDGTAVWDGNGQWNILYNCPNLKEVTVESISQTKANAFINVKDKLKGEIVINEDKEEFRIWSGTFKDCTGITSVSIPNTITLIGSQAFENCSGIINNIDIPDSVTTIDTKAFNNCSGIIGDLKIKDGIDLREGAFTNCTNITSLKVGSGITITGNSFGNCTGLKEVDIKDGVSINTVQYVEGPFNNCINLEKVTMGENINFGGGVGNHLWEGKSCVFYNCPKLEEITIGSISGIKFSTFRNIASALKGEITIVEGATIVEANAFNGGINITKVNLPSSLESIGEGAFRGCTGVQNEIYLSDKITSIGKYAFEGCPGIKGELEIKDNLTLGNGAFNKCVNITKLKVGNGVTISTDSFVGCTSLKEAIIGDDVTISTTQYVEGPFNSCINLEKVTMGERIKFTGGIGNHLWDGKSCVFYNCPKLDTITIDSISAIKFMTFRNTKHNLKGKITFAEGATTVEHTAFEGCVNITSISLPSTLKSIGENTFNGCTGVTSLTVNMTKEEFANVTQGKDWNKSIPVDVTYLKVATE